MSKKEANENYIHVCQESEVEAKEYIKSISSAGFSDEEFKTVVEFYLFNAPILKNDKSDQFGLKNLKNYGWNGKQGMCKLERELLKVSQISSFCFIRSTSIGLTLNQMKLGNDKWCVAHPRAVLKQDYNCDVFETGEVKISNKETRMECLF